MPQNQHEASQGCRQVGLACICSAEVTSWQRKLAASLWLQNSRICAGSLQPAAGEEVSWALEILRSIPQRWAAELCFAELNEGT